MMTNVPKSDLERGAYIVYTDEPGEVLSPGSTGGGAVFLEADSAGLGSPLVPKFSFNDVKNALDADKAVFIKWTSGEDALQIIIYSLVTQLSFDETPGNEAYSVIAETQGNIYVFSATDPDATMTDSSS